MAEFINWLTLIAPSLPIIGIGIIFIFQSFKWGKTKPLPSRVVLLYGTLIIVIALIFFVLNSEIKLTPGLQISSFSLIFIFESFLWFEEGNNKLIAWTTFIVGFLILITGIILSCFAAKEYWWIAAVIYIAFFVSPLIIFRKFLKGTSVNN
jgi:hypothetical protein